MLSGTRFWLLAATASDPEGDVLFYQWSATIGDFLNGNMLNATYNVPAPTFVDQDVELTLEVTDEYGEGTVRTLSLIIELLRISPSFADDMGRMQRWNRNIPIVPIEVPLASGSPTPTYEVLGELPEEIVFDAETNILSGTPLDEGSGTISIQAINLVGSAIWTIDYITSAPPLVIFDDAMFSGQYVTNYERACADVSSERYNQIFPLGIFPKLDVVPEAHLPSVGLLYGLGGNILFLPADIQREMIRNAWYFRRFRTTQAAFDRAAMVLGVCISLDIHDDPNDGIRTVDN